MTRRLLATIAALLAAPAVAQAPSERNWGETLRSDALALHDDIAANHPGPVNDEDPGFAARNGAQLALALDRSRTAESYGDYFFALRQYVSSFDDGHLGFGAIGDTPNDFRWPGFATRYDGGDAIVVAAADADAPVRAGARLIGCDGMSAADYAAATLGRMWGRWSLESQHQRRGALLFFDEGSRYIPQAKSCTFATSQGERKVTLTWRPISVDRVTSLMKQLGRSDQPDFAARTLADGTRWFSLPSFDGDPASAAGETLPGMIATMESDREELVAAPAIVLDLRGNGGGSSDWSVQIAKALWGAAAIDAQPQSQVEVDWRASPANLAEIAAGYDQRRGAAGFSSEADRWFKSVIAGLGGAIARGDTLWRHVSFDAQDEEESDRAEPAKAPLAALSGPVYVVTDASCASACLDALDLWTALGAIQVGRTTSADTLYMDIRQHTLPSGLTSIRVPMKVYRGRPRGANEPAVPAHRFDGDIGDTAAIERWIATLPERRGR